VETGRATPTRWATRPGGCTRCGCLAKQAQPGAPALGERRPRPNVGELGAGHGRPRPPVPPCRPPRLRRTKFFLGIYSHHCCYQEFCVEQLVLLSQRIANKKEQLRGAMDISCWPIVKIIENKSKQCKVLF
jgi:hypothetical protein